MLKKSILLNLEIGSKDFRSAFYASFALGLLGAFTLPIFFMGLLLYLIGFIMAAAFIIKGLDQIFYKSLFEDSGMLYMSLPMPEKYVVLGKLTAAGIYLELIFLIHILTVIAGVFVINSSMTVSGFDLTYSLLKPYLELNLPPAAIGGLWALIPLKLMVYQAVVLTIMLLLILTQHIPVKSAPGKALWPVCMIGTLIFIRFSYLIKEPLQKVLGSFYLADILLIFLAAGLAFILARLCCRILQKKYNC